MSSVGDTIIGASVDCVIITNLHSEPIRHWVRSSLQARSAYNGGCALLEDLKKYDIAPLTSGIRCGYY